MKIDKLKTLSQFVDELYDNAAETHEFTRLVKKYNDFLKQPLKKEMFVNEFGKEPECNQWGGIPQEFIDDHYIWYKSEKKVIFKKSEYNGHLFIVDSFKFRFNECPTLSDLAEATNGELKLKNVTI